MTRLYASENFPLEVVEHLRAAGHDVLTTHDAGRSNLRIEDDAVLAYVHNRPARHLPSPLLAATFWEMSAFTAELERELHEMEPETAAHFQRVVREMLLLARARRGAAWIPTKPGSPANPLPAYPMGGFMPGIDPHKLGQLPDDF